MKVYHQKNRPLSPHLTIYKPQLTSVLSIMHRLTGIGLFIGLVLVIIWFIGLSMGSGYFAVVEDLFQTIVIRFILVVSVWALWYHVFAGIRHLVWDTGYGLDEKWINPSAYIVLAGSLCLTIFTLYQSWSIS